MDTKPAQSASNLVPDDIQLKFHCQIQQHGHELISFVTSELGSPPSGMSITLERLEWPGSDANWVWFVGTANPATEQAVLHFFQTNDGKRVLASDGPDGVEFKLATTRLLLPTTLTHDHAIPDGLTAAIIPPRDGQEATILTTLPPHPTSFSSGPEGWLQVSPHTDLQQVLVFRLGDQADVKAENIGAWLVDQQNESTAYGWVSALVGARTVLVTPLAR